MGIQVKRNGQPVPVNKLEEPSPFERLQGLVRDYDAGYGNRIRQAALTPRPSPFPTPLNNSPQRREDPVSALANSGKLPVQSAMYGRANANIGATEVRPVFGSLNAPRQDRVYGRRLVEYGDNNPFSANRAPVYVSYDDNEEGLPVTGKAGSPAQNPYNNPFLTPASTLPENIQTGDKYVKRLNDLSSGGHALGNKLALIGQYPAAFARHAYKEATDTLRGKDTGDHTFKAPEPFFDKPYLMELPSEAYLRRNKGAGGGLPANHDAVMAANKNALEGKSPNGSFVAFNPVLSDDVAQARSGAAYSNALHRPYGDMKAGEQLGAMHDDLRAANQHDDGFNDTNTANYFDRSGYLSDNDPRMVARRAEAKAVHERRLQHIYDMQAEREAREAVPNVFMLGNGGSGGGVIENRQQYLSTPAITQAPRATPAADRRDAFRQGQLDNQSTAREQYEKDRTFNRDSQLKALDYGLRAQAEQRHARKDKTELAYKASKEYSQALADIKAMFPSWTERQYGQLDQAYRHMINNTSHAGDTFERDLSNFRGYFLGKAREIDQHNKKYDGLLEGWGASSKQKNDELQTILTNHKKVNNQLQQK